MTFTINSTGYFNGNIDSIRFYNDTIKKATIAQQTSRDWSTPRDIPGYYERGIAPFYEKEMKRSFENMREYYEKELKRSFEVMHEYYEKELKRNVGDMNEFYDKLVADKECATRLSNRIVSCHTWQDGIMIPQNLSSAFAQRLNFSPNFEAFLLLQRLIVGLYNNAKHYINMVREYGSWDLARIEGEDFMKRIIKVTQEYVEKQKIIDVPDTP